MLAGGVAPLFVPYANLMRVRPVVPVPSVKVFENKVMIAYYAHLNPGGVYGGNELRGNEESVEIMFLKESEFEVMKRNMINPDALQKVIQL